MKLKTIPLLLCLSALSLGANAKNEVTFSAGISSFAEIQNFSYSDGDEGEYTLGGLQFIGAANLNDNLQAQITLYSAEEEDFSDVKVSGNTLRMNFGKGFQNEGFKAYGSVGLFNEKLKNDSANFSESVNGLEFGAAIGYNFEAVYLDWGFTIRDSSDYETDKITSSDTDVTVTTGYLALTGNF